jgi:hypothetical protein
MLHKILKPGLKVEVEDRGAIGESHMALLRCAF